MSYLKDLVDSKLEKYRDQWRKKTPNKKWAVIYGFGDLMCKSIGVRAYSDMKVTWYSALPGLVTVTYLVCAFYTLWFYFNEGDILRGMPCTCVSGIVITVSSVSLRIR